MSNSCSSGKEAPPASLLPSQRRQGKRAARPFRITRTCDGGARLRVSAALRGDVAATQLRCAFLPRLFQEPSDAGVRLAGAQAHAHGAQRAQARVQREGGARDAAGDEACVGKGESRESESARLLFGRRAARARRRRACGVLLVVQLQLLALAWRARERRRA